MPRIAEGDVCLTKQFAYRVTRIREVNSKLWPDRWRIETERVCPTYEWELGEAMGLTGSPRVWMFERTYARDEGPWDYPCGVAECEGCEQHRY